MTGPGPDSGGGVSGAVATGGRGRAVLIVNLGSAPLAVRLPGPPLTRTSKTPASAASFIELNAEPATPVAGERSLRRSAGRLAAASLVLAPYSLTRVTE